MEGRRGGTVNNRPSNRAALVAVGMAIALLAAPAVSAANDSGMGGAGMAVKPVRWPSPRVR